MDVYIMTMIKHFMIVITLLLISMSASATKNQNVLLIHSYHAEHPWTSYLKEGFDDALSNYPNVQLFHEYMDTKRNPDVVYQQHFYDYLSKKYSNYTIDATVVTDDAAMQFVQAHHDDFFRSIPIVFVGVNRVTNEILNSKGMTGVFENRDLLQSLIDIKAFMAMDEVIVITDTTITGESNRIKLAAAKDYPQAPQQIHMIDGLVDNDISVVFNDYPADIPVFLIGQIRDSRKNNALMPWTSGSKLLSSLIPNPIFSIGVISLDFGTVGAHELNGQQHAKKGASLLLQVLDGKDINDVEAITKATSQWVFNWQNIKQHRLEHQPLPTGAWIVNKDSDFYEEHKTIVLIIGACFLIAIIIILLLMEVIRRGRKTRDLLVENETRYRDLAHAGANIFWETDTSHRLSYMSGNTKQVFDLTKKEMLGNTFAEMAKNHPKVNFPWKQYESEIGQLLALNNLIFKLSFKDQNQKIMLLNGKPVFDADNRFIGYRGITREITAEHLLSEKVAYQASHDSLTGLINRMSFNQKLKELVESEQDNGRVYICFLDLDNFKLVNDAGGHLIGDAMLGEITREIASCITDNDILGRLGGDEFGLILYQSDLTEVQQICENIIHKVQAHQLHWQDKSFSVGISIGVVPFYNNLNEVELLSKADLACYKAKELGKGRMYITGDNDEQLYNETLQLGYISSIAQVIEQDRFFLAKQRITVTDKQKNSNEHFEILIRYKDEQGNLVPPGLFIPAAEKHGLIILIDKWVIKTLVDNYETYFPNMNTTVSINLSGISLCNQDFIAYVIDVMQSSNIDSKHICFEITETAVISQINQAQEFIHKMKAFGYQFALDDFGSGASSFGYLKSLPVDFLKIDGSLVRNIVTEATDRAIVESINSIAHMMGMQTIAEFVEDEDIRDVLKDIGVDFVQGYGVHKPENCVS